MNKKLRDQEIDAQRYREEAEMRERQYQEDLRNARRKRNIWKKLAKLLKTYFYFDLFSFVIETELIPVLIILRQNFFCNKYINLKE